MTRTEFLKIARSEVVSWCVYHSEDKTVEGDDILLLSCKESPDQVYWASFACIDLPKVMFTAHCDAVADIFRVQVFERREIWPVGMEATQS